MIILKTTLAFFILLILTRLLGKKQMGQMTYFNYITGITMGTLTANIISTNPKSILDEIIGLLWWTILTLTVSYITLKSSNLRVLIDGQPTILIKNGKLLKDALRTTKMNLDDLSMLLRNQNIFSIEEVDYAIFEPNGKISVLKKQAQLNINKSDINISTVDPPYLPSKIIVDGKIIMKNLEELGITRQWLEDELKLQNIDKVEDVFYAEIRGDGTLYINKI